MYELVELDDSKLAANLRVDVSCRGDPAFYQYDASSLCDLAELAPRVSGTLAKVA